jgi:hypothetical protein
MPIILTPCWCAVGASVDRDAAAPASVSVCAQVIADGIRV